MANNIVSQSPSISEVKSVLAETSNSVGGLCTSPKIKKWSKWKPVRHATKGDITLAELKDVDFGLKPPPISTSYETAVNGEWIYEKPRGTASEPRRLGDFRNYNHTAMAIATAPSNTTINTSLIGTYPMVLSMNIGGSDFLIGLNDFIGEIGSYYYGVVFESGINYGTKHIKTASTTLAQGGSHFEIITNEAPFSTLQNQPIKAYHLLVNKKVENMSVLGSVSALNFLPIPSAEGDNNISEIEVNTGLAGRFSIAFKQVGTVAGGAMQDVGIYLGPTAPYFTTSGNIFFKVELSNNSLEDRVFQYSDLKISVRPTFFGDEYTDNSILRDSSNVDVTSILIPAGQSREVFVGATNMLNRNNGAIATPTQVAEIVSSIKLLRGIDRLSEVSLKIKSV